MDVDNNIQACCILQYTTVYHISNELGSIANQSLIKVILFAIRFSVEVQSFYDYFLCYHTDKYFSRTILVIFHYFSQISDHILSLQVICSESPNFYQE